MRPSNFNLKRDWLKDLLTLIKTVFEKFLRMLISSLFINKKLKLSEILKD